jgi:TctA family transporter
MMNRKPIATIELIFTGSPDDDMVLAIWPAEFWLGKACSGEVLIIVVTAGGFAVVDCTIS